MYNVAKLVEKRGPEAKFMSEFFNDVDLVKVNIGVIRGASASLSEINQQVGVLLGYIYRYDVLHLLL